MLSYHGVFLGFFLALAGFFFTFFGFFLVLFGNFLTGFGFLLIIASHIQCVLKLSLIFHLHKNSQ